MKGKGADKPAHNEEPIKVMTMREVCAYLRLSRTTIYKLLKRNQIPAFQVGSYWRFNVEHIERWCSQQENPTLARK